MPLWAHKAVQIRNNRCVCAYPPHDSLGPTMCMHTSHDKLGPTISGNHPPRHGSMAMCISATQLPIAIIKHDGNLSARIAPPPSSRPPSLP
jgi:hypothetical protein